MALDDELRPRIGFAPGGGGGAASSASASLSGRLAFRSVINLGLRPGRGQNAARTTESSQRVVVKVSFRVHGGTVGAGGKVQVAGNLGAHLRYIQREAAVLDPGSPTLVVGVQSQLDADAKTGDLVEAWKDDRHHYRIVISPENGGDLASVEDFGRSVMERVGGEIGRNLEWVGAVHTNTDQPHMHVVLRGEADGKELRLDHKTVSFGIRSVAQEEATKELGPRSVSAIRADFRAQTDASKVTELDRILARGEQEGVVDLAQVRASKEARLHLAGRMKTLVAMRIAVYERGHRYKLEPTFLDTLRGIEERNRAASEARRLLPGVADPALFSSSSPREAVVGTVVSAGLTEGGGRAYVALRTSQGAAYAEVDPRFAPRVGSGGVVEIRGRDVPTLEADELAGLNHGRVRAGASSAALLDAALAEVVSGKGRSVEGGVELSPAGVRAVKRRLGVGNDPPRLRVLAARNPRIGVDAERWSPLDRYVVKAEEPAWPGGREQVEERKSFLVGAGLASDTGDGRVFFKKGVTADLRRSEIRHETEVAAQAAGTSAAEIGGARAGAWIVVDRVDLAQGPGVILQQDQETAVELLRDVRGATSFPPGSVVHLEREEGGRGVVLRDPAPERDPEEVER